MHWRQRTRALEQVTLERIMMFLAVLVLVGASEESAASTQAAKRPVRVPPHADSLPTLIPRWTLPASLAPVLVNSYAPRMALDEPLLAVYDHHGGRLAAIEATTGQVLWHVTVPTRSPRVFAFTPLLTAEQLVVASDRFLCAYGRANGAVQWQLATKGVALNGLARSQHHIVLPWIRMREGQALAGVQLWGVDSRDGRVEWSKSVAGRQGFVLGDAARVYYAGSTGVVMGLDAERGDSLWQLELQGTIRSAPVLGDGRLYVRTALRQAGKRATALYAIDASNGTLLWHTVLEARVTSAFLADQQLATVDSRGHLVVFGVRGAAQLKLALGFAEEAVSLQGLAFGSRAYVVSQDGDGRGYVHVIDLRARRVLSTVNSLPLAAHSIAATQESLFLDGEDGTIYAYRLDRQDPPRRREVSAAELAADLLARTRSALTRSPVPLRERALQLASLGPSVLPVLESALADEQPHVVSVAARALGRLAARSSLPALAAAIQRHLRESGRAQSDLPSGRAQSDLPSGRAQSDLPSGRAQSDPLPTLIHALAELRDSQAVPVLQQIVEDETLRAEPRRAAYVALGAMGTPVALAPVWTVRAVKQVSTMPYAPPTSELHALLTAQTPAGKSFSAALSSYLGGYNDIWVGPSDRQGRMSAPLFTGLTTPERLPDRPLRLRTLQVGDDNRLTLAIESQQQQRWVKAPPVTLSLSALAADRDSDGLTDIVERRLHLCVTNPDCDGDGLQDGEDLNPLASSQLKPSVEQRLFREAFFAYYAFLKRRGLVVIDPGASPSFEVYGRQDPVLSLRRPTIGRLQREVGLHAIDYVSFGGPYAEDGSHGPALPAVSWSRDRSMATIGMDIVRAANNAVAYNVTLKQWGEQWVVVRLHRVWSRHAPRVSLDD